VWIPTFLGARGVLFRFFFFVFFGMECLSLRLLQPLQAYGSFRR
jgi:hypothetical protein